MATTTRRPTMVARVAATGISVAGTAALVGVMSSAQSGASSAETPDASAVPVATAEQGVVGAARAGDAPASTEVVVIELHRTVYVDEHGNPVTPNNPAEQSTSGPVSVPATGPATRPATRSTTRPTTQPTSTTATTVAAPSTTSTRTTTVTTAPPRPRCSGSGCP